MRKVYAWQGILLREKGCRWFSWARSCPAPAIRSTDRYCKTRQASRSHLSGIAACNTDRVLVSLTMYSGMGKWPFEEGEGFFITPGPPAAPSETWAGILHRKSTPSFITEI